MAKYNLDHSNTVTAKLKWPGTYLSVVIIIFLVLNGVFAWSIYQGNFQPRAELLLVAYFAISILLLYVLYKYKSAVRTQPIADDVYNQEKKYKALIEDSGINIIVINNTGFIKFANKNVENLLGYTPDELVGMSLENGVAPPHRTMVKEVLSLLRKVNKYQNSIDFQVVTKAGVRKWVICKMFAVNTKNGEEQEWQIVLWDIDEEKKIHLELQKLENERKEQQKLIQDIIDNVPSVIYIKDTEGKYLLINKKMEEVTGIPSASIVGHTDEAFINTKKFEEYKKADQLVLSEGILATIEDSVEVNGELKHFLMTKFPLFDENGNVKNICGLATDITEQKESELKLVKAKSEAEMAKSAQEAFLANISHEIRTPMNGIMGMANLLLSTKLDKEQKEYIENIQDSGKNLLAIINDLLDFSKIKSGKFQFDQAAFKLKHTIKKAVYPLQFKAEEKLLTLGVYIDENVPDIVIGDPIRLQQIVINLAGNAVKFTSTGRVDVKVSCPDRTGSKAVIRIDVEDTGIGIAENKLEYIFESFTQNNVNTSRRYGGTGLGLAIVKQLVELQKGSVSAKSEIGKGSVFSVVIPFAMDAQAVVTETRSIGGIEAEGNSLLEGINVLVAEDNVINQKVVLHTLQKQGAKVTLAFNGQDAIEQVKANAYDVVLMDLQMPEVDGYKATRYIRQVLKVNVPILAMTADALKGEAEKCFEAGMTGFISKPFDPSDLYQQILRATSDAPVENFILESNDTNMDEPLIDFSFLHDISGNDPGYINDVLEIFMSTTPQGVEQLQEMINRSEDWDAIGKQAHFLKSSVSVIKIRGVYDQLAQIEKISFGEKDMVKVKMLISTIVTTFNQAMPVLLEEKERNKPA